MYKHTELHGCNIAANRGNIDSNSTVLYLLGQHTLIIDYPGSYPSVCADLSHGAIHEQCISIIIELHGCNVPASRGDRDSNRTVLYRLLGQHALAIDYLGSYHTPTIVIRQHALTVDSLIGSYLSVCDDLSARAISNQTELHGFKIPANRGDMDSDRTVLYCLPGQRALTSMA